MLDQVPNLGWTWNALHEGAKTAKKAKNSDKKELQDLFDNKISSESLINANETTILIFL